MIDFKAHRAEIKKVQTMLNDPNISHHRRRDLKRYLGRLHDERKRGRHMKLVSTEAVMTALCQHCDSHIEMCEECGMREIIESAPSAWISVKDRLPEESGTYLTVDMDTEFPYMRTLEYSAKWNGWNCCDYLDDEKQARAYELHVTHWMPLPDAPEVEE